MQSLEVLRLPLSEGMTFTFGDAGSFTFGALASRQAAE
jgi:hypothetical protein